MNFPLWQQARIGYGPTLGSLDREGSSDHTAVPLGCVETGLGRKSAKNVALDIKTKLGGLALQHQASAQHQHPKPKPDVVVSSSDPSSSGDDSH